MHRQPSILVMTQLMVASLLMPTPLFAGLQVTPDNTRVLVNSDVGIERWAITEHPDGTLTGNVFRADGGAPAFIACTPRGEAHRYRCWGGDGCVSESGQTGRSPRGVSQSPINDTLFVSKDVGDERWAITLDTDDTLTGNVFHTDGGPPSFVYCVPQGDAFQCFGADACLSVPCGETYAEIGTVSLPGDFFVRPEGCDDRYTEIGHDIAVPPDLFVPPVLSGPVVFSQPPRTGGICYGSFNELAIDFTFPTAQEISSIRWWGGYANNNVPTGSDFVIRFYWDSGRGQPESEPAAEAFLVNVSPVGTDIDAYANLWVQRFEVALPRPFVAEAGTTYYVALESSEDACWYDSGALGTWWRRSGRSWVPSNLGELAVELSS